MPASRPRSRTCTARSTPSPATASRQGRLRLRAGDVVVLSELQLFTDLTDAGIHVNVVGGPIPFDTRKPRPATEMAKASLLSSVKSS
ncbi:hypothetical protein [Kribbella sindirgiensis]|uniref:Uncharacterized protein n=1 Tax=Kribbella sindirgiensis TaxID=1124744 RepID=A0A4R0I6E2_9ACTN|nr:hypothetical protein [Kribbella sindirgiensis]TCC20563.1 hypothetical protein E0H50_36650 [Kribbella sindirgiensis]